ncbi:MAG: DedA family protein [Sphingobium sp.]
MSDWIINLIDGSRYWGIALLMFIENIFPPLPSEMIMGIGGIRVGQGRMDMLPLLAAGTVGSTMGNYCWYMAGRLLGMRGLYAIVSRVGRWLTIDWDDVRTMNGWFRRYGEVIVFVMRFMPAFRTMVSVPAGLFAMSHARFLVWTLAGTFIWNLIIAGAGYYMGAMFSNIDAYLGPLTTAALLAMLVWYLIRLIRRTPTAVEPAE